MNVIKRGIYKLDAILYKLAQVVVLISVTVLVAAVAIQVFARYVLDRSPRWSTELSCFMLVYMVFWGASIALRDGQHVGLDITKFKLPEIYNKIFRTVSSISIYICIAVVFYFGSVITYHNIHSLSEAMKIPYSMLYVNLPIAGILMGVWYTAKLLRRTDKEVE